jgi:hypothetical protein
MVGSAIEYYAEFYRSEEIAVNLLIDPDQLQIARF